MKTLRLLLAALAVASALPAAAGDDSLYQAFGRQEGIARLTTDFAQRLKADPRLARFFEKTNLPDFAKQLSDQFCVVTGGPCVYEGAKMKAGHADYEIRPRDFNSVVEVLQQSMDAHGIPFATQNRLLALLAPMHRDIVNQP